MTFLRAFILGACIWLAASAARAEDSFQARVEEAATAFEQAAGPMSLIGPERRRRIVTFAVGSLLFVISHELGHAAVSEFRLPVLGKEEDAADQFATLVLLNIGTRFARQTIIDAARGLAVAGRRSEARGDRVRIYDEHGLDEQRAIHIVCMVYGSDTAAFAGLAEAAKLPPERRESCPSEFAQAGDAWERLLEPHVQGRRRSLWQRIFGRAETERPQDRMSVVYSPADSLLHRPARSLLVRIGLLEAVRDFAVQTFDFKPGIVLEAKSCGHPNASWDPEARRLTLCYELVLAQVPAALAAID